MFLATRISQILQGGREGGRERGVRGVEGMRGRSDDVIDVQVGTKLIIGDNITFQQQLHTI